MIIIIIIIIMKSRLSLIVRVNVVLNRTVVDSDWRFDNLCGSHLQSQSELYHVSWWYMVLYSGYWHCLEMLFIQCLFTFKTVWKFYWSIKLSVGGKMTDDILQVKKIWLCHCVFVLCYFVFEGNFLI